MLYNFSAFLYVAFATSSRVSPFNSAIFCAVYFTFLESFLVPLTGYGARYGLSVSINILSIGIMSIISGAFFEFLNVTGPAIDI